MFALKKNNDNEIVADGWENYGLSKSLTHALEINGYYSAFNYFKQNWKKIKAEKDLFVSYLPEEAESKTIFLIISSLNFIKSDIFNVQCLILFSNDTKAIEFYETFYNFFKNMKNLKAALILEQDNIVDDRSYLTNENPELIIGSVKRIDYVIKKHFLNVFLIKNLILDLTVEKEGFFGKESYEDILSLMPESSKKIMFYEENEFFKKKFLKDFEQIL